MQKKPNRIDNYFQIITWLLVMFAMKYIFRLKISGEENLKVKKPIVFVSNHRSKLDPFIILSAVGLKSIIGYYPWRFPLAKHFYEKWWIRFPAWMVGCYKIESKGDLEKSLMDTFRAIDNGYSIIFFPEGKMVKYGEKAPPKKGITYLIQKRDFFIQPVHIKHSGGTKRRQLGRMFRAKIEFGEMLESKKIREEYPAEKLHMMLMEKIYALGENIEANNHMTEINSLKVIIE
jgi:1-acyl-sn-glycerol-3-phosphate acyltransferase